MSKLNDYLLKQGIVSRDDWKELKDDLAGCIATQAETIMAELSKLKAAAYLRNLPPEEDEERYDDFEADGEPLYEVVIGDECGLTITKIAEEGCFFATDGIYFSDDEEGYLLRLPPRVVQLGRVGMRISS